MLPSPLRTQRGMIVAPAGCGKTELLCQSIKASEDTKPILILTHTVAGVAALRARLKKGAVPPNKFRLATLDGWSLKIISFFPGISGHAPTVLTEPNYFLAKGHALNILKSCIIDGLVAATYSRLFVDEYQDCSTQQHAMVQELSRVLPTCIFGDPLQAIFNFSKNDPLPDWRSEVVPFFPLVETLNTPWRWNAVGTNELGQWLLEIRKDILAGQPIDLRKAPPHVTWVQSSDWPKAMAAANTPPHSKEGSVIIIELGRDKSGQYRRASQTPGAIMIEAVDMKDLIIFAQTFDVSVSASVNELIKFAGNLMTNIDVPGFLQRISSLQRGTARNRPTKREQAALDFITLPNFKNASNLLVEINADTGVRCYRPDVLKLCLEAFRACSLDDTKSFHDTIVSIREQSRAFGRSLPKRGVGSTLLVKGLEAEVVVIMDAGNLSANDLYVAMTRGSHQVIVCSQSPILLG